MALRICVLASGSSGNCIYVASETTHVLVDAGLSCRETLRRLAAVGGDPGALSAICLTHEHADHRSGLAVLHRRLGVPLYGNAGTVEAVARDPRLSGLDWNVFTTGSPFAIGDLLLEPFSVPHDSYDPVGFTVACGDARAGLATDIGIATGAVRERLRACAAVVIESNHDEELLKAADRPWSLKQRIMGRQGHLSNAQAGELMAEIAGAGLRDVLLAHLSAECNSPHLARRTVSGILAGAGYPDVQVRLTYPDKASEVVVVG
jgi:phosphoribosyl 1,2-cyclic phosphodiesterase